MKTPAWRRYLRFWGSNIHSDVDDELRFHLDMLAAEYRTRGIAPDDARQLAERRFGDEQKTRVECVSIDETAARVMHRGASLASLRQDIRYAARLLRRQAATATLAVVCLGLGIGATTSLFSVADALLIRPLPFVNGDRLYLVATTRDRAKDADVSSYPDYLDWRAHQHSFTELAAFGQTSFSVVLSHPIRASGAVVSPNFFRALGVVPERGRLFADGEDQPDGPMIAIVSHGFAERELGGVDHAVGSTVSIRGIPRTVVGVVPDRRAIPVGGELWTPIPRDLDRALLPGKSSLTRSNRGLQVIGWLAPNVTIDQARAEFELLEAELVREYPSIDAELTTKITSIRDVYVGFARPTLLAMIAATILVLLVACANVAGIQLARATSRIREIAVRSAIGASRGRVFRQLLTESVMLALAGGVLGIGLAYRSSEFAEVSVLGQSPGWLLPSVDLRVLAFAAIVSMLTGIVFGVAPAMRLTRVDPADALRGGRSTLGPSRGRLQRLFVVVQIALSIVLVVATGLSMESVQRVEKLPLGFDERGALMFTATLQTPQYDIAASGARFAEVLEERAAALPGVSAAGATSLGPFRCCSQWALAIDGQLRPPDQKLMVPGNSVTPGYFQAMGIPLVRGRAFTLADAAGGAPVMVVSESFAQRFWPNGEAVGHRRTGRGRSRGDRRDRARREDHADRLAGAAVLSPTRAETDHQPHVRPAYAERRSVAIHGRCAPHRARPRSHAADLQHHHGARHGGRSIRRTPKRRVVDDRVRRHRALVGDDGRVRGDFVLRVAAHAGVGSPRRARRGSGAIGRFVLRSSVGMAVIGAGSGLVGAFSRHAGCRTRCTASAAAIRRLYVAAAGLLVVGTLAASLGPANRAAGADPMTTLRVD